MQMRERERETEKQRKTDRQKQGERQIETKMITFHRVYSYKEFSDMH